MRWMVNLGVKKVVKMEILLIFLKIRIIINNQYKNKTK